MTHLLLRIRERKLFQWGLAYLAAAFALVQVVDIVAQRFAWPEAVIRLLILVLALGFFVALILAWYHGDRGAQRVSGPELIILALVLGVGGALIWGRAKPDSDTGAAAARAPVASLEVASDKSIAVLPFENLSGDPDNAYFAGGMQEMILTKLADINELKVISRTSTLKYASHPDNLKTIALQLGVRIILEGSVQKSKDNVLINVQLIDANSDAQLWAQAYQRGLENVFDVEGDVAQKVADALRTKLTATESDQLRALPTKNGLAYDFFLQGEYYINRVGGNYSVEDCNAAIENYRAAVKLDPSFALAYARLAYIQLGESRFGGGNLSPEVFASAKSSIDRSLQLSPNLAEAHLALGYYEDYAKENLGAALVSFQTAHDLKPRNADTVIAIGLIHVHRGEWDAAIASMTQALEFDPRNIEVYDQLGRCYSAKRDWKDAQRNAKEALAISPESTILRERLFYATLYGSGSYDAALRILDAAPQSFKDDRTYVYDRAAILISLRNYHAAMELLMTLPDVERRSEFWELVVGNIYWAMGNVAGAQQHYANVILLVTEQIKTMPTLSALGTGSQIGLVLARSGRDVEARKRILLALDGAPIEKDFIWGTNVLESSAEAYAAMGDGDAAIPLLDRLISIPAGNVLNILDLKHDPSWDRIRSDPRFQKLIDREQNHASS